MKQIFLTKRFWIIFWGTVLLFVISAFFSGLFFIAVIALFVLTGLALTETVLLFSSGKIIVNRLLPEKFSNGNENEVRICFDNKYPFFTNLKIYEDYPVQFQIRDNFFSVKLNAGENTILKYELRPVKRGEYVFGSVNTLAATKLGLISRIFRSNKGQTVAVYPSFMQMRRFEFLAISDKLTEAGLKRIRKVGVSSEFEHIRHYVQGDDPRKVNWQATARKGEVMVNNYQDERSQQIYCLIDKGRVMKMPFDGMSMLDYAINGSLVLLNTALIKGDKAGLITFSNQISNIVPAERRAAQMNKIMEVLYNQRTQYKESSFELLSATVKHKISQRSLLVLFTNFETTEGLKRQLYYLRSLAKQHLLLVVFFINTGIREQAHTKAGSVKDIYINTIAGKFIHDKNLIVKELERYGIHTVLTAPQDLTVNTVNKYLELKARGLV